MPVKDANQNLNSFIRLSSPDVPIYRIFPLWDLEETVRLNRLTFVLPSLWEDPYEIIGSAIAVTDHDGKQKIINQDLPPLYAQCWSFTEESDTLLRAYSRVVKDPRVKRNMLPREEGVRVRTTARKLLTAISNAKQNRKGTWFVGAVEYLDSRNLQQQIANAIGSFGVDVFRRPENRARLLLYKRIAFTHESEVRTLFVQEDSGSDGPVKHIDVDVNSIIEEITFDPRLEAFERKERVSRFQSLGYEGGIGESELYGRRLLEIALPPPAK